jgi:WD repeat and SOF domain-containing protein 1
MMKHPTSLSTLVTGACDGEIRIWNVTQRKCVRTLAAHEGMVRALCAPRHGRYFFSVDNDSNIKQWNLSPARSMASPDDDDVDMSDPNTPMNTIIGRSVTMGMDHHYDKPLLVTCGERVELWEETRTEPLKSYKWGADTLYSVKFNPVERDICATTASDRSIILYDIRKAKPLRKFVMEMRSNTLCWNPMEAFHFTAANEDHDLYTYDMRNLKVALMIHKDHVSAVIDVDYSPTGKEFVSGSYDKTLRIFPSDKGRSREVYHTKRMQRLTSVVWSLDNKYILCGSDEMDVRIWKANASEKLGVKMRREEAAFRYQEKLKEKFGNHPEIKRIARHHHVPKHIYHAQREKRIMLDSKNRKEANRRNHSKPGTIPRTTERTKHIVREEE